MRPLAMLLSVLLLCANTFAAPTTRPADVQKVLDDVKQAYGEIKSIRLKGTVSRDFDLNGEVTHEEAAFDSSYASPDRFKHSATGDATVGSDGKQCYFFLESFNRYTTTALDKKTLPEVLTPEILSVLNGQNPSLLMAVTKSVDELLFGDPKNLSLAGNATIDGADCIQLKFDAMKTSVTLFIDAKTHLVRGRDVDALASLPKELPNAKKALVQVRYSTIEVNPATAEDQFAWAPPAGARESQPEQVAVEGAPQELEGQAAPEFKLKSLSDESVALSDLKGSVVVLDFWATWCGPCRESLPELAKLDEELCPKGLKVYCVNLEEPAATVKRFVTDHSLKLNVLLDSNGAVSRLYKVMGIPQTVVIGKDGTIKKILVGYSGEESILKNAIDAALAE